MSGLNIKLADLQISDFHAPECWFCDDILKKPSASGGVAPRPLPGALPLDPTGDLLRPPDPRIIFLLFHFSPVPCLGLTSKFITLTSKFITVSQASSLRSYKQIHNGFTSKFITVSQANSERSYKQVHNGLTSKFITLTSKFITVLQASS